MDYKKPLVIKLVPNNLDANGQPNYQDKNVYQNDDILQMPNFGNYSAFKKALHDNFTSGEFDSAIISTKDFTPEQLDDPDTIESIDIKSKSILKEARQNNIGVFNVYHGQAYDLSTKYNQLNKNGTEYAPSDDQVLAKRNSFSKNDWEHHQAQIFKRFKAMMPLSNGGKYDRSNHLAELTAPKRGLEPKDLTDYFSWKSNHDVIPSLMQDDMVGMPGIDAKQMKNDTLSYHGKQIGGAPLHLKTIGMPGYMIPMKNLNGDSPKYQIGTDIIPINVVLKAKAEDGVSIQKSEYYDKNAKNIAKGKGEYNFKLDGQPSNLCVDSVDGNRVTMMDAKGKFDVDMKQNVKSTLEDRGYDIPSLIDTLTPTTGSKYMWPSPGNMIGTDAINKYAGEDKAVSPNQCGFVSARKPQNGHHDYMVVVAEGALKGRIAAKYMNAKDEHGKSLGDEIAGDSGVIVAQVPGVAASYVQSVERIYKDPRFKDRISGTYIAMDADGRKNKNVAQGIHEAYDELKQYNDGKVKVMSWDPAQKGIDDALLAVANHKIELSDMKLQFGGPDKVFPLDQATSPNPYHLDGTRANRVGWQEEYAQDKQKSNQRIHEAQQNAQNTQSSENSQFPQGDKDEFDFSHLDDLDNQNGQQQ